MTAKRLLLGTTILTSLMLVAQPVHAEDFNLDYGEAWTFGANENYQFREINVGDLGGNTMLTVQDGAIIDAVWGFAVGRTSSSGENSVEVSGEGSSLSALEMYLGFNGFDNDLTVSGGGRVDVNKLFIGLNEGSYGNTADVSGGGSSLLAGELYVGHEGGDNTLTVSSGGTVSSSVAVIGFGPDSDGNSATVQGVGSRWDSSEDGNFTVGYHGSDNSLFIVEGGAVTARSFYIGISDGPEGGDGNNSVTISGWSDAAEGRSSLTAGSLFLGATNSSNSLWLHGNSQLTTGGATIGVAQYDNSGSSGNTVRLSGSAAAWDIRNQYEVDIDADLFIGVTVYAQYNPDGADNNALRILNGASVTQTGGKTVVGATQWDTGNELEVSGAGSSFTTDGELFIGDGSKLIVGTGASVHAGSLSLSDTSFLSVYVADEVSDQDAVSGKVTCLSSDCEPSNGGPSSIEISGDAIVAGSLEARVGTEYLQRNRYTILTAGSITGEFSELSVIAGWQTPAALAALNVLSATIGYTETEVYLSFVSEIGASAGLNNNQANVSAALDGYYNNGGELPIGFMGLFGLSGPELEQALSELSGEPGSTGGASASWQAGNSFLNLLLGGFGPRRAQAPGMTQTAAAAQLDGMTIEPTADVPPAPASGWTMWGSAFGGMASLPGEDARGSHDSDTSAMGLATGWDHALSEEAQLGFAIAGGGTRWDVGSQLGSGRSTFLQLGAYGSQQFGAGYLSVAGAYAWHAMSTERDVNVAGTREQLDADFNANSLAGRIEAGHRFGHEVGLIPYAAVQAQAMYLPSYEEDGGDFALDYDSNTATSLRTELGLGLDGAIGAAASLYARAAWAHDWTSDPRVNASFQSLPGTSFTVYGAEAPENIALVSAGAEMTLSEAATLSADFNGEFAEDYQSYAGSLKLSYSW